MVKWRRSFFQAALYVYKKSSSFTVLIFLRALNIFWEVVYAYHFIFGSTLYLWEDFNANYFISGSTVYFEKALMFSILFMRSCLHLPFYHLRLRWRKSYNSFYNPNRPWLKSPPAPRHFGLFSYPFSTYCT